MGYTLDDSAAEELAEEAVALAAKSDAAVIFAGLPDAYESEGYDRRHMRLPEQQNHLIERVSRVRPNLVIVFAQRLSGGDALGETGKGDFGDVSWRRSRGGGRGGPAVGKADPRGAGGGIPPPPGWGKPLSILLWGGGRGVARERMGWLPVLRQQKKWRCAIPLATAFLHDL